MGVCFNGLRGLMPRQDGFTGTGYAEIAHNVDLSVAGQIRPFRSPLKVHEIGCDKTFGIHKGVKRGFRNKNTSYFHGISGYTYVDDPCTCPMFIKQWCDEPQALGVDRPDPAQLSTTAAHNDTNCWTPQLTSVELTYKNSCGHESRPSQPSNVVKAAIDDPLTIVLPPCVDTKYEKTKVCVYVTYATWDVSQGLHPYPALGRNLQGRAPEDVASNFETNVDIKCFKVAEYDCANFERVVTIPKDKKFGRTQRTKGWMPPPEDMCLAGESTTGSLVGYTDRCLQFSVRNHPYAWRVADIMAFGCEIKFACHYDLTTWVITEDCRLFIVRDDTDPTQIGDCRTVQPIGMVPAPCVSKFSTSKATLCGQRGLIYPSEEGLISVTFEGSITNLSEAWLSCDQWRCLTPECMVLGEHKGNIFYASPGGAGVFWLGSGTPEYTTIELCPECFVSDCGRLYMVDCDGCVYEWDAGDTCMAFHYRSNPIRVGSGLFTALSVGFADVTECESVSCPGVITIYRDGKAGQVCKVSSSQTKRINRIKRAKYISFDYRGEAAIRTVCLGSSILDTSNTLAGVAV